MLIIFGIIILMVISFYIFVFWHTHIDMNKEQRCSYSWGNFNEFLRQFNSYHNWYVDNWKGSFFGKAESQYTDFQLTDMNYYIHADIIKINGKCLILDPISYLQFIIWRNKKWNEMIRQ